MAAIELSEDEGRILLDVIEDLTGEGRGSFAGLGHVYSTLKNIELRVRRAIGCRVDPDLCARLIAIAKEQGVSPTEAFDQIVGAWVRSLEQPKKHNT